MTSGIEIQVVIGNMDAEKPVDSNQMITRMELMMLFQNLCNHLFSTILCVWDGNHPYDKRLLEDQSRDHVKAEPKLKLSDPIYQRNLALSAFIQ